MAYNYQTIKKTMLQIGNNEVYLPALQRHFVWKPHQITMLFDSMMKGYPIGTFLFWNVDKTTANQYTFYKFISEYHERTNHLNQKAAKPELKDRILGVLDGQQRLSSMYIALQGTYAYKMPRKRYNNPDAYPVREMYLDLLHEVDISNSEDTYAFQFLTAEEAKKENQAADRRHYWFLVKTVLLWDKVGKCSDYISEHKLDACNTAMGMLVSLWNCICQEPLINYFEIDNPDLDNILDIFVRVNSAGAQLSKSDLLFSTIVANWDNARDEMELLILKMNEKGDTFRFNTDFVIRACLMLTGCPILFKVETFKKSNIDIIKSNWGRISQALLRTIDLLVEFGFSDENLTSYNSILPISYYLYQGGSVIGAQKQNMKKYLITALLNGVFGTHGDTVLREIRSAINTRDIYTEFSYLWFQTLTINGEQAFRLNDADIEAIFEDNQKNSYTFMVLSLLYPHLKLNQYKFHQDHMHPYAAFSRPNLLKFGLGEDQIEEWQNNRNKLPNLQLLEGSENQSKQALPLEDWIRQLQEPGGSDAYKRINYIPGDVSLKLTDFEAFYSRRKALMVQKLKEILC